MDSSSSSASVRYSALSFPKGNRIYSEVTLTKLEAHAHGKKELTFLKSLVLNFQREGICGVFWYFTRFHISLETIKRPGDYLEEYVYITHGNRVYS